MKSKLTWTDIFDWCEKIDEKYRHKHSSKLGEYKEVVIYGIPKGGIIAAAFLCQNRGFELTHNIKEADIIVDDIVDSGKTKNKYLKLNKKAKFECIIDKLNNKKYNNTDWIEFPWEADKKDDIQDNILRILQCYNIKVTTRSMNIVGGAIDGACQLLKITALSSEEYEN